MWRFAAWSSSTQPVCGLECRISMSGFARRRSSGEIINATLLEVFLALVFVVFALAIFEQRRAIAAEGKLAGVISADEADVLRRLLQATQDSLRLARIAEHQSRDSLNIAQATVRRLLFDSPYPPDCEPNASPAWLLTITLSGPGQLSVVGHRSAPGLKPDVPFVVSPAEFRAHFAALAEQSRARGCRYYARVRDTPNMPKAEYKSAMSAITSIFRFRGAFQ